MSDVTPIAQLAGLDDVHRKAHSPPLTWRNDRTLASDLSACDRDCGHDVLAAGRNVTLLRTRASYTRNDRKGDIRIGAGNSRAPGCARARLGADSAKSGTPWCGRTTDGTGD